MKRPKQFMLLAYMLLITMIFPITASADSGPKPSVNVTFDGMGDELCYGTLLSKTESTGPASVWDGTEDSPYSEDSDKYRIWKAFVEYEDSDGFYFLQNFWQVNETGELNWGYYPPKEFKVLLYYPESGRFLVSGVFEHYAFDSYFTVDMENGNISTDQGEIGGKLNKVYRSYQYGAEVFSLVARVILTVLIELGIAWLFGYRKKRQYQLLAGVNIATQLILNILLNVVNYRSGHQAFVTNYILYEVVVFILEAGVYWYWLRREDAKRNGGGRAVIYALVANFVSFVAGMGVAMLVPGIF